MKGVVSSTDRDRVAGAQGARGARRWSDADLVDQVTCADRYDWTRSREAALADGSRARPPRRGGCSCVAYDFGIKRNILRLLRECGFDVTVVPAATGNPRGDARPGARRGVPLQRTRRSRRVPTYAIDAVGKLVGRKVPIFGICLGHQIAALALGGKTFKLKFGHRGANHPVKDLRTGRVAVTSQNHGYAVAPDSLPARVQLTHVNLNDQTCEGFFDPEARLYAVQFHPESSPGPHDSHHLFCEFRALVADGDLTGATEAT